MKTRISDLNILFILNNLNVAGGEVSAVKVAKYLKGEGATISFLSQGGPMTKELNEMGIPTFEAPIDTKNPLRLRKGAREAVAILEKQQVNVLYCDGVAPTMVAYFLKNKLGKKPGGNFPKVVTVNHGLAKLLYYKLSMPRLNKFSDHVITVCDFEKKKMVKHGLNPDLITIILNSIDLEQFDRTEQADIRAELNLPPDTFLAGYAGRLTPEKGGEYFVECAKIILEEVPEVRFVVAGDGSEKAALEELCVEYGIDDRVFFLGFRKDIHSVLGCYDLLIIPSKRELLPIVLLEAMSMRVPVVSTDVGGVNEALVDGETGMLVPPLKPELLAEKSIELIKNETLRNKMAEAGRKRSVEVFDIKTVMPQYGKCLLDCLNGEK